MNCCPSKFWGKDFKSLSVEGTLQILGQELVMMAISLILSHFLDIDYIREVVLFHSLHSFNVYFSKERLKRQYHSYHQNWYTLPISMK